MGMVGLREVPEVNMGFGRRDLVRRSANAKVQLQPNQLKRAQRAIIGSADCCNARYAAGAPNSMALPRKGTHYTSANRALQSPSPHSRDLVVAACICSRTDQSTRVTTASARRILR